MRLTRRQMIGSTFALLASGFPVLAQSESVRLVEETKPGEFQRFDISLAVSGAMKVDREGKTERLPLETRAKHQFVERNEIATGTGTGKVVRYYTEATSNSFVGGEKSKRTLGVDRRLILAQRGNDGTVQFNPDGPLTRDELDLIAEHFDTFCLPLLLPNKDVKPGETWPISPEAAQTACLFAGLIKNELVGKLIEVKDGKAIFAIEGKAEGIEHGASVKVAIAARGTYDTAAKKVVALTWEQTDDRDRGPIGPAIEAKATILLTRTPVAGEPKELSAAVREKLPADSKIPELLMQLRHTDPNSKFEMVYPRDWHIVVQNQTHLVMRLMVRGELIAQATIAEWKPKDLKGDRKAILNEFVNATAKQANWEPKKVLENGPIPAGLGRQLYRLSAAGLQDGMAVVQSFHLLSGPDGQQIAVTCLTKQETSGKVGTRDVALVNAIDFPAKK